MNTCRSCGNGNFVYVVPRVDVLLWSSVTALEKQGMWRCHCMAYGTACTTLRSTVALNIHLDQEKACKESIT